ncbi:glycosyltransferase family 4 protein [Hydrogenophaga sp. A37]|uniref:glycosyltransferase family 4 protein n=1 Tax=Hydrogenophaga sp. A37 TaxID=1945864 RepID=UPI0015599F8A|nr:glycosyltransferase family 4 protein [Hydrogenophaga sp. A37]
MLNQLEDHARREAARMGADWHGTMVASPESHEVMKQALTLLLLGLFDTQHYLTAYPDIATCGADPLLHYVEYGDREGRWPNAHFNPQTYRTQFGPDGLGPVCALYHYAALGEDLGLGSPTAFDPLRYLSSNPELQPWLDRPLTHFLHLGKPAGLVLHHRIRLSRQQCVTVPPRTTLAIPEGMRADEGINVVGPLDRVSGLGVSARGYLEGLRLAGATRIGTSARQLEFPRQTSIGDQLNLPPFIDSAKINVVHMNGDTLPMMLEHGGEALFRNTYNIAVWYWELPTLRPEWQVSMKYFNEFWAPTPFIAETLKRSTAKRVTLLPPYLAYLNDIQPDTVHRAATRNFVYCFDANSVLERKNPGALLEAFWQACPVNAGYDDVTLTFKITYPDHSIPDVKRLYEAAQLDSRIRIIDHLLSDAELHELIGTATAYVSPHRSEGLGLTVVEAMGAGVPVITISFGGLSSFIRPETAFPVRYDLVELAEDHLPYPQGFVWADPDVDSLADNLRFVLDRPDEVRVRTEAARRHILEFFCSPRLVASYRAELERLSTLA